MEIRQIKTGDEESLAKFFKDISAEEKIIKFFHPHPFTKEFAYKLVSELNSIKDKYFVAEEDNVILGYAMLRGWDEGYDVPSFGICIHSEYQGKGVGKALTQYCIKEAIKSKSPRVMLKVYKSNKVAVELYKKLGFVYEKETNDNKQYIGYLYLS